MPVTIVQIILGGPGSQKLYVLETLEGVDIQKVFNNAEKHLQDNLSFESGISKGVLKDLCTLAISESDKLLIKYACCKGQNLSKNKSSKLYGFSDYDSQETRIKSALNEVKEYRGIFPITQSWCGCLAPYWGSNFRWQYKEMSKVTFKRIQEFVCLG